MPQALSHWSIATTIPSVCPEILIGPLLACRSRGWMTTNTQLHRLDNLSEVTALDTAMIWPAKGAISHRKGACQKNVDTDDNLTRCRKRGAFRTPAAALRGKQARTKTRAGARTLKLPEGSVTALAQMLVIISAWTCSLPTPLCMGRGKGLGVHLPNPFSPARVSQCCVPRDRPPLGRSDLDRARR